MLRPAAVQDVYTEHEARHRCPRCYHTMASARFKRTPAVQIEYMYALRSDRQLSLDLTTD